MATFTMLPDGVTGTNQWQNPPGGTCAASNVDADNGDTDYCYETLNSHEVTFTMAAPSVAEANIASITNVRISLSAAYTATSGIGTGLYSSMEGVGISNGTNTHTIALTYSNPPTKQESVHGHLQGPRNADFQAARAGVEHTQSFLPLW